MTSDGYSLHYQHWLPDRTPLATVIFLHGIQSHSGWYEYSSRLLAEQGIEVLFVDRRGSGPNQEARGHAPNAKRLIDDIQHFLEDVQADKQQTGNDRPVFLASISWGSKPAFLAALESPDLLDGMILICPALFPLIGPNLFQRGQLALAKLLGIHDRLVPLPLTDPALFTSIKRYQDWIRNDPLALHEVTVSFLQTGLELEEMTSNVASVEIPICLMLAGKDQLVDNDKTVHWLKNISKAEITRFDYPDAEHVLEMEECREEYIQDLINWILKQSSISRQ